LTFNGLDNVVTQKIELFITTTVRNSNPTTKSDVGVEVFTAVAMKYSVFRDVALCRSCEN
jgi:hypothetical protein